MTTTTSHHFAAKSELGFDRCFPPGFTYILCFFFVNLMCIQNENKIYYTTEQSL